MESDDKNSALDALESIEQAKRETAAMSKSPKGYYAVLGAAVAIVIFAGALDSGLSMILIAIAMVVITIATVWYSKKVPTWGMGKVLDPSSWPLWVMAVALVAAIFFVGLLKFHDSDNPQRYLLSLILAVVVFLIWAVLGPVYDRAYRRQLESK